MQEIVERYLAAWNEKDASRRRKLVDELWAEDGSYTDPLADANGRAEIDGLLVDVARIAAATADRELLTSTLSSLTERRFAGVTALRAELGADVLKAGPKPETVRKENGRLVPLLPRDLTWDLYARVLNAEGVR